MKLNSDEVREKQKNLSSKKKKKKTSIVVRIIRWVLLTILSVICIAACLVMGVVVGIAKSTPALEEIQVAPTQYPTTILDTNGTEILKLSAASAKRIEASLDEVPEVLKWAFIDLEDERFYSHKGIDLKGIGRAAYQTLTQGSTQGGSTITQQLIKNNVFETGGFERSKGSLIRRKIQEQILALGLEKKMSKDEILINYLNTINLGGGNYGVKMAAKYYFNRDLSQLTTAQCAVIAAITQNPSGNNPARHPEENRKRMETCLEYMKKNGHITQSEYDEAMAEDVYAGVSENAASNGNPLYSYFVDSLIDDLIEDLQKKAGFTYAHAYNLVYTGGLTVYSTQDPVIQEIVDREVNNWDNYPGWTTYGISWDLTIERADGTNEYFNQRSIVRWMEDVVQNYNFYDGTLEAWTYKNDYGSPEEADEVIAAFKEYVSKPGDTITYEKVFYTLQPQVSFTVMDYTNGHVLALCGGRGEKTQNLTLNRAVDTTRQPGSCFKVLAAYAPALDAAGYTLGTAIDDSPFHYGGNINRDVHNWWGDSYRGLSTVREGIRDSMNVLAVKTLYDIGEDLSIQYLQNFGFTTIDPVMDAGVATALGGITNGITNKEITAAYGSIANKGVYNEPVLYTKIVSMDGTVLLENIPETHTVLKESTASLLTSAMLDVVNGGTGSAAALWTTQVAGKTGTTSDDKDLWFCGFVPNGYAASIWTGYDENVSITWGGVYHEYLWATIMSQVLAAKEREGGWFEMTGGIVQATICKKSGKIPNGSCGGDAGCVITEYFAEGTVPSASCDVHTTCRVCADSKLLPNEYCPKVIDMVCRVRPMDVTGSEPKGTTEDSKLAPPTSTCNIHNAEWESKSREEESRRKEEEESRKKEEEEQSKKDEETRDDEDE
ncbi:MAG: transglycosylase domain-containing protein [Lachnospiraceae bacterium]|nr:transglycosylase domain-containing protein [Lachnospiraceae bacterium]